MAEVTSSIPAPHMQRVLEDVVKRRGFKQPRYAVSAGSKTGDNYLGVLYRVEVTEAATEGEGVKRLALILKGMPASERRRQEMRCGLMFDNEHFVYRVVLPDLARFVAEKGVAEAAEVDEDDPTFPNTPRCFDATRDGAEGEDTIVLEDMRPLGFTMTDRQRGVDPAHIACVFRALAFLHASSFAMEAQQPERFARLRGVINETIFTPDNPLNDIMVDMMQRTYGFIAGRFPEGSDGYNRIKKMIDIYPDEMAALVRASDAGGNAISHGDCWTNNLLYKYSESGSVEKVCLLDFQITRYAPPVLDLLYFVFSCAERDVRDKHLDRLLREYHDTLSDALRRLGCDPDQVYPWETMQTQLRERGRYGLAMAAITVPLFLADSEEIPDLDSQFEKGVEIQDLFNVESKNGVQRDKRICDALEEMMDRGWI